MKDPETLLNTLVFMIGKGFALKAGKEHHVLWAPPFNFQFRSLCDHEGQILYVTMRTQTQDQQRRHQATQMRTKRGRCFFNGTSRMLSS